MMRKSSSQWIEEEKLTKGPYLQPQQDQHSSLKTSFSVSKVSFSTLRLLVGLE